MVDTKKIIQRNKFWAGILLAQIILFYAISKSDFLIKLHQIFFETQMEFHQYIFSWIPFSFGDIFYLFLGGYLVYIIQLSFRKTKIAIRKALVLLNIFYFVYQLFWGLLYFQPPIIRNLEKTNPTIEELKQLTTQFVNRCNQDRTQVKDDRNGNFTIENIEKIKTELVNSSKVPYFQNLKKSKAISIKKSLFSDAMDYTGILGYYNPFTAEAQYNKNIPAIGLPFTLAHENAHQKGIAREEEASFFAYLEGKNAKNINLKYSTDYFALKSLMIYLSDKDSLFVKQIFADFSAGLKKDFLAEKEFYEKHNGIGNTILSTTNDWFLKSNQQDGEVNYSYFTVLLIRHEIKELRFTTQFQKHK